MAEHPEVTELCSVYVMTQDDGFDLIDAALDAIVLTLRVELVFLALYDDPLFQMLPGG